MNTTDLARQIRLDALCMAQRGGGSHIGSVFSMADIMAVLYAQVLNVRPAEPDWPDRDRFILSKGHAGAGVYACLAAIGFFPHSKLLTHYQDGSDLSGHVSHKNIPGVELSTGSLGHGLPVAAGLALGAERDNAPYRVFVLMSDGECDEGSNWEAAMLAAHHRLGRLTAIIDYNKIQSLASTTETLDLEPFADKWRAFGWEVREVDGHEHTALRNAFEAPCGDERRPVVVLAHTVKGKGVSFMEHSVLWHYRSPQGEEFQAAIRELTGSAR